MDSFLLSLLTILHHLSVKIHHILRSSKKTFLKLFLSIKSTVKKEKCIKNTAKCLLMYEKVIYLHTKILYNNFFRISSGANIRSSSFESLEIYHFQRFNP